MQTFDWTVRVYYEDTDSGGVVYYANYLKFMERARTEWLRARGFEQDALIRDAGVIFAVRSASVDYLRPARFNEQLTVRSTVHDSGRANVVFDQRILRADDAELLTCGRIKIASLDAETFRPKPLPKDLLEALSRDA